MKFQMATVYIGTKVYLKDLNQKSIKDLHETNKVVWELCFQGLKGGITNEKKKSMFFSPQTKWQKMRLAI